MSADEGEQLPTKTSLIIREDDNDDDDDAEEDTDELTGNELAYAVAACNDCSSATGIRFISPLTIFSLY